MTYTQVSPNLVLVVEDDPDTSSLLKAVLASEGLEVVVCGDGRQAQRWLTENQIRPGLVVVDVRLPDMNGLDLCQEFTQEAPGKSQDTAPVLVLSAHGDPRMPRLCRQAGASAFLDKCTDLGNISAKVRELMAASA